MRKQRILAVLMATVLVLSLIGCKSDGGDTTDLAEKAISIDFENGSLGFTELYMEHAQSDASDVSLAQYNGSTALKITKTNDAKVAFLAFDVNSLLGDKAGAVKSFEMTIGAEYEGSFKAVSGNVYYWTDTAIGKMKKDDWSVYMATKNPKVATFKLPDGVTFGEECPVFILSLNAYDEKKGGVPASEAITVDNIRFYDAAGNVLAANKEATFVRPDGFKNDAVDRANLVTLLNPVEFAGFQTSGGAWGQNGFTFTEDVLNAIVPGSTIEISYSSGDGSMWLVFPGASIGWTRVANDGNGTDVYRNDAQTIAQIDYEQIVKVLGEDKSQWGDTLQCESASAWEVYSVKVGMKGACAAFKADAEIPNFGVNAGAWAQAGANFTPEFLAALTPGSVVEVSYSSADGKMWLVVPGAPAGWTRVGQETAVCDGSKCYVTYEQIMEACAASSVEELGDIIQCEGSSAWEVYAIKVGKLVELPRLKNFVKFEGFSAKAGAWAQAGADMTDEIKAALVPDSVLRIDYTSADGKMWAVLPGCIAGWTRAAQETAVCDGARCYITYEQLMDSCGGASVEDLGGVLQCESSSEWEVYGVSIGQR